MITLFNRKELIITMDMKQQSEIRNILSANGIDYKIKTTNLETPTAFDRHRARLGSAGIDLNHVYEYKIYVNKKDYNAAMSLIRTLRR